MTGSRYEHALGTMHLAVGAWQGCWHNRMPAAEGVDTEQAGKRIDHAFGLAEGRFWLAVAALNTRREAAIEGQRQQPDGAVQDDRESEQREECAARPCGPGWSCHVEFLLASGASRCAVRAIGG